MYLHHQQRFGNFAGDVQQLAQQMIDASLAFVTLHKI